MTRVPIPPARVQQILDRAGGCCEIDGLPIQGRGHIHHRQPRGMGSSVDDPHSPANLLYLHPGCHLRRIETNRAEAYANGWLVKRGFIPEHTPLLTHRGWVILSASGAWVVATPPPDTGDAGSSGHSSEATE